MAEQSYGTWKDCLVCLAAIVFMQTPSWHSSRWHKNHPEASPSSKKKEVPSETGQSKPFLHRLLDFVEHPLFTLPVGLLGGIVGLVLYSPVLGVCGICVILAFHRAEVMAGSSWLKVQLPVFGVLSGLVFSGLYGLHVLVDRKLFETNMSTAKLVADTVVKELPKSESTKLGPAFGIVEGTPIISRDASQVLYWVRFNGVNVITPIHVMVLYTITNRRPAPVMISRLSLEIRGEHGVWRELDNLPSGPIWGGDLRKPTEVSLITPREGFLFDNISNVEVKPGHSIQGWIVCQYPSGFPRIKDVNVQLLRLRIRDTAGDDEVQNPDDPATYNSNVMRSSFHFEPIPNVDLTNFQARNYGP